MTRLSLIPLLAALLLAVILVFSPSANAAKGPIVTNKACPIVLLSPGRPTDLHSGVFRY